jgi:hypothetical protein
MQLLSKLNDDEPQSHLQFSPQPNDRPSLRRPIPRLINCLLVVVLVVVCSACATIVGQPTQTLPISSAPSEASITVVDETGVEVFKGATPTSVTLQKSTGKYWGKKSFTVTISKPGFQSQVIPVTASANGWYIAGNFVFGGLIGWFIVDPLNGNMYTLSPDAVAGSLATAKSAHNNTARDGSIAVMLIEDVPAALRSQMVSVR